MTMKLPLAAWLRAGLCALLLPQWAPGVQAQTPPQPSTRTMIDALMPAHQRSRNLLVRQTDAAASAADAPVAPPGLAATPAPTPAPGAAPLPPPALNPGATAPGASTAPAAPSEPAPSLSLAIQFEANSARVRPESGPVLGSLVAAMQAPELKASRFLIEGHADARGVAAVNQRLSQERADEVRLFLVALGVHPARLKAVGKGTSEPVNPRDPAAPENRRVRVVTVE